MKLEDRLRRELSDTAEQLALDKDTYEHVLNMGRRRRRLRQLLAASGTVMVVTALVGLIALRPPGDAAPILSVTTTDTTTPVTSITSSATSAPAAAPATTGVLVATPENGIVIEGFNGTSGGLTSDLYYEAIAWVISDGAGGIIFQHEVTPLPWLQGTILHLPAGAANPVELVAPEPGTYLRPLDTDSGLVLYRVDREGTSEVRTIDPLSRAIRTVVPATEFLTGAAADAGVVVAALGGDCPSFEVFGLDGSSLGVPAWDQGECELGFTNDLAFSGGYLYTIEDEEGRNLVRRDFATGEATVVSIGDVWSVAALPDGTVAFGGSEVLVGSFDGAEFVETHRVPSSNSFTLAEVGGFPAGATLGSGAGELPCDPIDTPPLASQGLAPAVEAKRTQIFDLAASCDMVALAEIARADGTAFSYGGEIDPLRSWIRSARSGFDVMSWIVRLFNTVPALDEVGTYAWPAVHATNSEEDWQDLSGILSAAEFEQYSLYRDSGWLGLRIGIAEDGTWRFVVAGD